MFASWQSVKVTDESLESFGRSGRVTSATDYKTGSGKTERHVVDVQLDGDTEPTTFEVSQVVGI